MLTTILFLLLISWTVTAQETTSLTILHTSNVLDNHPIGADGIGGTARVANLVTQARAENGNVLLVDGGDRFINPTAFDRNADIMNELGYDGMTFGNHEFNGGNVGVLNFVEALDFPLLAANIDFSASPILADRIAPSAVVEINGLQIGLIGLANEETPVLSSPGADLVFLDDEVAITQVAVDELNAQGINIIVLIAHREANENAVLASSVSGVDVIVGGSDDTLLNNMDDNADFPYPIETQSLIGEPVLIVQTNEGNDYLGQLSVTLDDAGVLTDWSGDTIRLDDSIPVDEAFDSLITDLYENAEEEATVVGMSETDLIGGEPCREAECTMGNIIADAIRADTGAQVAIYNSGGIRASVPAGNVTDQQLALVLPFPNTVATLELRGSDLLAALEHGVSLGGDASVRGSGRFLQVSGLRYNWNPTRPVGSRIEMVEILNEDGTYSPLAVDTIYSVATNDFIRQGGDDFSVLDANAIDPFDFGFLVIEVLTTYISDNSPINVETEERITRVES
ncbi:MAG: 5'-nucleotidase C-terminal domain-containing protein [Chloroflexota bacterium]